jgi:hypothetical protein
VDHTPTRASTRSPPEGSEIGLKRALQNDENDRQHYRNPQYIVPPTPLVDGEVIVGELSQPLTLLVHDGPPPISPSLSGTSIKFRVGTLVPSIRSSNHVWHRPRPPQAAAIDVSDTRRPNRACAAAPAIPPMTRPHLRRPGGCHLGRSPTLRELQKGSCCMWVCCGSPSCDHTVPMALVPFMIRWGPDASSDVLRQRGVCSRCGHKGVTLQHPGWGGMDIGVMPFPADRLTSISVGGSRGPASTG